MSSMPRHAAARYPEFDGLRGITALTVVLCHWILGLEASFLSGDPARAPFALAAAVARTPLIVFWNPELGVAVFFPLSGFVLSAGIAARPAPLTELVVRRWLRLALALIAAGAALFELSRLAPRAWPGGAPWRGGAGVGLVVVGVTVGGIPYAVIGSVYQDPVIALLSVTDHPHLIGHRLGAVSLVAAALVCRPFAALLRSRPCRWLGRVSFSVYLLHIPLICSLGCWVILQVMPAGYHLAVLAGFCAFIPALFVASELATRAFDRPAIIASRHAGAAAARLTEAGLRRAGRAAAIGFQHLNLKRPALLATSGMSVGATVRRTGSMGIAMTNEERDLITRFIQRVGGAPAAAGFGGGSVPSTTGYAAPARPLPPIDPQADALIADLFARYPEARYRLTQLAFVQEQALAAAQARIGPLEAELQQARQAAAAAQPAQPWGAGGQDQGGRGFLGGLFGGGSRSAPPPQPQYAPPQYAPPQPAYGPGYNPGMFQRGGSGFLGSALTTAAGVAGGMLAAEAITGLFSGHSGFGGGLAGAGLGGGTTIVENIIEPPAASPWATPAGYDPADLGGAPKADPAGGQGFADSGWQQAGSGWQQADASDTSGGGWDDSGGDDSNLA